MRMGTKLGEGAFGAVFKGVVQRGEEQTQVAIKQMHMEKLDKAQIKEVMTEARIVRSLK